MKRVIILFAVLGLVLLSFGSTEALECLNCLNISDPRVCNTTITCGTNEACFQDSVVLGQQLSVSLGCTNQKRCNIDSNGAGAIIGRDVTKRQDTRCLECCASDRCNDILCARRNPALCIDDESIDCPRLNSLFGVCNDIHHAKSVCPKFCGLCDVVDGAWAEWSSWSTCDVTCEDGTQSRSRTCTNPPPAHGGLDCVGDKMETKQCHKQLCPVHGKWSGWSQWGTCSTTCDVGIQNRQRTCTNPAPQRFGNHCFGVNIDNRLCMPRACSNGHWSTWEAWGTCSVTCGGGFKTRTRSCTNPRPSLTGRDCVGEPFQAGPCSNNDCQDVSFMATFSSSASCISHENLIFNGVKVNEGLAYNSNNGRFRAPISGIYKFSATICGRPNNIVSIAFVKNINTNYLGYLFIENSSHWFQSSTSVTVHLNASDQVWTTCLKRSLISGGEFASREPAYVYNSHFSGFLIRGDLN
ncbi:thrombospondin-2-like isoform X1 [Mercenaria mercenaria]|uniref:thrombospondin-2-like isoform X1 n=1 Tax=Mercenaria mercenaria TaxID=6596 RepID=UPI00234E5319|nr:thrombospondin-2-like isoform X1 [Mercenaria mercenaria]